MGPREICTKTLCSLNKRFLHYCTRNNRASRQMSPKQMGHEQFVPEHVCLVQIGFKLIGYKIKCLDNGLCLRDLNLHGLIENDAMRSDVPQFDVFTRARSTITYYIV